MGTNQQRRKDNRMALDQIQIIDSNQLDLELLTPETIDPNQHWLDLDDKTILEEAICEGRRHRTSLVNPHDG